MSTREAYQAVGYYTERRGVGNNNLVQVLGGIDQKHGGRVHALFQRLHAGGRIFYENEKVLFPTEGRKLNWLDIGAGAAPIARLIREKHISAVNIISVDFSRAGILAVPQAQRPPFVVGDTFSLPVMDGSVDVLTAHDIIEHLADPLPALEECFRVLGDNGLAQIVVPAPSSATYYTDPTHIDPPVVSTEYFRNVLEKIGFKEVEVTTRGFGKETKEHFRVHGEELFRPEGGDHIYAFGWKNKKEEKE